MQGSLFDMPQIDDLIQPMAIGMTPEALFERVIGISPRDAVEEAFWAAKFQGTLSQRLNMATELEHRLLREFRENEVFGAELCGGADPKGNVRAHLILWIKDSIWSEHRDTYLSRV